VPLHFTAFHPDYKMRDVAPTPPATPTRAREIALRSGLRYVYTGNVRANEGGSTYCPGCGCAVSVRDWYRVLRYGLTEAGACVACGTLVAGVYDGPVGRWGARRLPLFVGG
jgi:pyruvate formate lyase activating enzyme